MTCTTGDRSCETPRRRGALVVLALMTALFIALSVFSFVGDRVQAIPQQITYGAHDGDQGKRVFQAFNCMGCHTIVGNGAYLGPDLTKEFELVGPAWLEAFLPSAGTWPTRAAVQAQLLTPAQLEAAGVASFDEYLTRYPGANQRIERRGGKPTHMPNLQFSEAEVDKLIAFLKYTSAMDTEGWPPKVMSGDLERRLQLAGLAVPSADAGAAASATPAAAADSTGATASVDPAAHGAELVQSYGCIACHAPDDTRKVGPGWGGLFGSTVKLADGSTAKVDAAYLAEAIRDPNARVAEGFPAGVMPPYGAMLKPAEVDAMVAYLESLGSKE